MREEIVEVLKELCNHNINKQEAESRLMSAYIANIHRPETKEALRASVNAIYFSDSSDYRSAHYKVIRSLTGVGHDEDINISHLFNSLNPEYWNQDTK